MQEIRFRAWDTTNKKWLSMRTGSLVDIACGYEDGEVWFTPDIIFLQFTGLLDCHGKEVYEGDILDCQWNVDNRMEGEDKGLRVVGDIRKFYYDTQEGFVGLEYEANSEKLREHWVIGNIYENPELLPS